MGLLESSHGGGQVTTALNLPFREIRTLKGETREAQRKEPRWKGKRKQGRRFTESTRNVLPLMALSTLTSRHTEK